MMNVLLTGAAGFIGSYLAKRILRDMPHAKVVGLDLMTDYYSVELKQNRLKEIECACGVDADRWVFVYGSIADRELLNSLFCQYHFDVVVNLAAQAGVRYSIENPDVYMETNVMGFYYLLETCRHYGVQHLVYASSSSIYGVNDKIPYSVEDKVDEPVSLYAATKRSDELMAHAYSKLYGIACTGLRFFTVYGPAGRPDMAYYKFTERLCRGEKIQIYNYGNCLRDFTYIDDVIEGIVRVMVHAPEKSIGGDGLPVACSRIYNIGNGSPVNLLDFVTVLQEELMRANVLSEDFDFDAHKELLPMQPGDVLTTFADVHPLERDFGYKPTTTIREGLRAFVEWYAKYDGNRI